MGLFSERNRGSTERGPPLCHNSQSFAVAKHSEITTKTTQQQGNLCSFMHSLAHLLMRVSSVLSSTSLRSARSLCPVLKLVLFCCCVQFCSVWWRGMLRIIRFVVLIAFAVRVCSALLSVILLGFQFVCLFFVRFFFFSFFQANENGVEMKPPLQLQLPLHHSIIP